MQEQSPAIAETVVRMKRILTSEEQLLASYQPVHVEAVTADYLKDTLQRSQFSPVCTDQEGFSLKQMLLTNTGKKQCF